MGFSLGKAISSIGGSFLSKAVDYDTSRKLQHDAQDFNAEQYAKRHQITVEDMRKAGLNPTLAAWNSGQSAASSPVASTGAMQNPAIASATYAKLKAEEAGTRQAVKESQAREGLYGAQGKAQSAIALKEELDATRKLREFKAVDEREYGKKVMPVLESMPSYMRGPLRAVFTSGSHIGNWFRRAYQAYQEQVFPERKSFDRAPRKRPKPYQKTPAGRSLDSIWESRSQK